MGGGKSKIYNDSGFYSNDNYHGSLVNGWRQGFGIYLYTSGDVYAGHWEENVRSGWGMFLEAYTGETYNGQWNMGSRNGLGCLLSRDGFRYFGPFLDGRKQGPFLAISKQGIIFRQIWSCDEKQFSELLFQAPDGSIDRSTSIDTSSPVSRNDIIDSSSRSITEMSKSDISLLLGAASIPESVSIDGSQLLALSNDTLSTFGELGLQNESHIKMVVLISRALNKCILKNDKALQVSKLLVNESGLHMTPYLSRLTVGIDWESIKLENQIASGGFGSIIKGRWKHIDVAVKVFHTSTNRHKSNTTSDSSLCVASQDFVNELQALSLLRHPNIITLIGVCLRPRPALVLEYVACGSLFDILHKRKNLRGFGLKTAIGIAHGIASGMAYAHRLGVWHCDLKSSNILVGETWAVKIADFGLSWSNAQQRTRIPLGIVGTFQWTAPCVLRSEDFSAASDVYSFGVIFWEVLTRQIPFASFSPFQVLALVGYGNMQLKIPNKTPRALADMLRACLHCDRDVRPSFADLCQQLNDIQKSAVLEVEDNLDAFFSFSN